MQYKRSRRVAELLREEISRIILYELKDPAVGLVTITSVKVAEDLRSAKVYVSVIGDSEVREASLTGLGRASHFIEQRLRGRTDLKYAPHLTFYFDDTLDYADTINRLLQKIKKQ
jgi:ribosome-binding factor A